jgi:hypothetical protein
LGFKSKEGYFEYKAYQTSKGLQAHGGNSFEAVEGCGGA